MSNTINVGDKAPDFTLPDTNLKPRSLKDFKGKKAVLAFFVGAFTAVCTKEACSFRDSTARLTELNAQVIGISVNDPVTNKAFAEENHLTFPILSDSNLRVIRMYGMELPEINKPKGDLVAKRRSRAIVILDKNNIIRHKWIAKSPTNEPDYREIEQILQQID